MRAARRTAVALLLAALMAAVACAPPRPNGVVLIVVDTLRADHLGLYGYARDTSPGIDRWAERAAVFEQALATAPWTLPTFGSIFTGHLPTTHLAGRKPGGAGRSGLNAALPTLTEQLHEAGFATGALVANPFLRERFGFARGFESYDYRRGRRADETVDLGLAWLDEHSQEPFFLFLHLMDPHLPYQAPEPLLGRYSADAERLEPERAERQLQKGRNPMPRRRVIKQRAATMTPGQRDFVIGRYDEEVAYTDTALERLFDALAERDLWDSTLVVLTSDHGEELFDHDSFEHGHTFFQELLRVPLVIWAPRVEPRREATPVSVADVAPTILEAVGLEPAAELSGVSLWRELHSGAEPPERRLLAEAVLYGKEKKAIVEWPFKLIWEPESDRYALFDLAADPGETRDLAGERAALVTRLAGLLRQRLEEAATASPMEEVEIDAELEQELRALGYID